MLFESYERSDLELIVYDLAKHRLKSFYGRKDIESLLMQDKDEKTSSDPVHLIIHDRALRFLTSRLSKSSGDLRVCFQLIYASLQSKLEKLRLIKREESEAEWCAKLRLLFPISVEDLTTCYDQAFESRLIKSIRKLPRTHMFVLRSLHSCYTGETVAA